MAGEADVRSLQQLETFLIQTEAFRTKLLKEVDSLHVELRRLTQWVEQDAVDYWSGELIRAQHVLVECQSTLTRCMSYVREDERRPCTEEKKRLRKAEQRRALCEQKLKLTRAAAAAWERNRTKGRAQVQRCQDLADADIATAIQRLRSQLETLHQYTALRSGANQSSTTAAQISQPSGPSAEPSEPKGAPPCDD